MKETFTIDHNVRLPDVILNICANMIRAPSPRIYVEFYLEVSLEYFPHVKKKDLCRTCYLERNVISSEKLLTLFCHTITTVSCQRNQ